MTGELFRDRFDLFFDFCTLFTQLQVLTEQSPGVFIHPIAG